MYDVLLLKCSDSDFKCTVICINFPVSTKTQKLSKSHKKPQKATKSHVKHTKTQQSDKNYNKQVMIIIGHTVPKGLLHLAIMGRYP